MAKKDEERQKQKANRRINKLSSFVQSNLDKLYSSTFYSQPSNKYDLDTIKSKLDDSIDNIVLSNKDNTGKATMSSLYSRAMQYNDKDSTKDKESKTLETLLNDNAMLDSGMLGFINDTTTIFDYDNKIDTVLKYMPKLEEALECRKDNVLSADHFSKDFINVINNNCSGNIESYNEHIKDIKDKYEFQELAEKIYDNASKYGEQFVYIVPTKKAIARLLSSKKQGLLRADLNLKEGKFYNEETGYSVPLDPINESAVIKEDGIKKSDSPNRITLEDIQKSGFDGLQIEIDKSGMISSVVEEAMKYQKVSKYVNEMSLNFNEEVDYSIITEAGKEISDITNSERVSDKVKGRFDKTIKDDLSFDNFDYRGQDGLIDKNTSKNGKSKKDRTIEVPGTIVRLLERKRVIPLYIENKCFGYYYIETEGQYNPVGDYDRMQDPTMSLKGSNSILSTNSMTDQANKQNSILRYISNQISQFIDANFVNSNQDLRDEIYMILKYNEQNNISRLNKMKVTFIPPDDMEHVYFKMNDETHRGISDLHKALFPATLYSAMYITNCIWTMTRSQDKRVYYVKQTVDTNISKTLLNTIDQIKKGNMNIRQIENINHILNITGQFNDFVIPKNSSGETPIEMEVLSGQQIDFKTELMTTLEEMAVNSTDVPMEMIQMRQSVEYATQLSMSSSKFLRKVYNRQSKYQKNLTRIFNKLYNNEYDDNITLEVKLPPPMFLNITNTNQMITNVTDYSASVADIMVDDEDDNVKKYVIREINKANLGSYLDIDNLEEIVARAKQLAARDNNDNNQEE